MSLIESAVGIALPYIVTGGFKAIPEDKKGIVVAAVFADQTEFGVLVRKTKTELDDKLLSELVEDSQDWYYEKFGEKYGTDAVHKFPQMLDDLWSLTKSH